MTTEPEIKQMQPFASPAEEAILNMERTTDHFRREVHLVLRHYGLTSTQYNALHILRSRAPGGMTCSELGNRLVSSDPDITRLLDRLAKQRLVRRRRDMRDRRVVLTDITEEGMQLLEVISPMLEAYISELLKHMEPARLKLLVDLLGEARHPGRPAELAKDNDSAEMPAERPMPATRAG